MVDKRLPDESVLAFRDDERTTREFRRRLQSDPDLLWELADARLLALALALPEDSDETAKWSLPQDEKLVSYLLNSLPGKRRRELEVLLKGNPRAMKRLLELRHALVGHAASQSRAAPFIRAHEVDRDFLGTARFRRANGHLEFQPDDFMAEKLAEEPTELADFEAPDLRDELFADRLSEASFPPDHISRQAAELGEIADAAQELVMSLRQAAKAWAYSETIDHEKQFAALSSAAHDLSLRLVVARRFMGYPVRRERRSDLGLKGVHAAELRERRVSQYAPSMEEPTVSLWRQNLRLQGEREIIELSGKSGKPGQLELLVQTHDGEPRHGVSATIVWQRKTFDSGETNDQGRCQLPLHEGESVLLIGDDRMAELNLRSDAE